jgi:phosphomannomutase
MPFVAMLEILSESGLTFSGLLKPLRDKFYISEEINFEYSNKNILEEIKANYSDAKIDSVDGYDFNYPDWRFNLRLSNTQNLLRLNVEADSGELLKQKIEEVSGFINKIK